MVSYETLMTLQGSYTKQIYEALDIESDHIFLCLETEIRNMKGRNIRGPRLAQQLRGLSFQIY